MHLVQDAGGGKRRAEATPRNYADFLREELVRRDLDTAGSKEEVINRLFADIAQNRLTTSQLPPPDSAAPSQRPNTTSPPTFDAAQNSPGLDHEKDFLTRLIRYLVSDFKWDPLALGEEKATFGSFGTLHLLTGSLSGLKGIGLNLLKVTWDGSLTLNVKLTMPPMTSRYSGYLSVANITGELEFELSATTDDASTMAIELKE
ncbi:hypothetical protein HPB50_000226 [Hyalomma asiaticum]|uniref:Uncharacterized protein n=1 Tax=Hyalomma asiaticum TaxID=266040 RepID=A0ACB7SCU7_HYAAI|nr:hypothetical protein HPB50_000226 [Hyalomma asiaticum]